MSDMETKLTLAWIFFVEIPVFEPIESSHVKETYPSTLLEENSFEFEFETDRAIYLGMRDIHLHV